MGNRLISRIIDASLRNQLLVVVGLIFLALAGWRALRDTRLDAIPDISDVQVIVYTEVPGQAPLLVEEQVTYPLTSRLLAVPQATTVRGYSFFGLSFAYVLFEDGTDLYWARSRVLEVLSSLSGQLPPGINPRLGPDATGVGWAFMYALNSDQRSLHELRSLQDWYLRFGLASVEGVAEVASVGGHVRQYQVEVDPVRLRAFGISLAQVKQAIQAANLEVGGRVLEIAEREHMVRGRGYLRNVQDLEAVLLGVGKGGTPVTLKEVAEVRIGPDQRRGVAEWNGRGETVGGIVVVRAGADTLATLDRVKERLDSLRAGLPDDVRIDVGYDRSGLIRGAVATLTHTLVEESLVVALVCLVFLFHLRSALVAILSIPASILGAFVIMRLQGLGANIMSLGGIAISIGVLVDAAIIMVDNAHKHLEEAAPGTPQRESIRRAAQEVGPTLFFTLLILTLSFLPVFTLEAQEGRLFKPLAFTKTYSMAVASVLAITAVPVLMLWFVRGRIISEASHPVSRLLRFLYRPVLRWTLRRRWLVILASLALILVSWGPARKLGSEFMPPLWEGDLLYMPTTLPGLSVSKATEILQQTDRIIASFPEVQSVLGKVGRADTATDPAPLSMLETTIVLKDPDQWRPGMTKERLIEELDRAVRMPGLTNAWTMPIKTRLDMLSTGIRTPVGIKLAGPELETLQHLAAQVEAVVVDMPGTRTTYAERVMGGSYLDFEIDRQAANRYGISVAAIQDVVRSAIGGMNITWTVEGRERYPVSLRYPRSLRQEPESLEQVLVDSPMGYQIPLGQLATLRFVEGPPGIKSENARPNAWIYVDLDSTNAGSDIGGWVRRARDAVNAQVQLPEGYDLQWSGQFESMQRARERLSWIVPSTLLLIVLILYLHLRSPMRVALVLSAIPFSLVGSVWLLDSLDYQWSVAVVVGLIALAGLAVETGVVMLLYIDLAYEDRQRSGAMHTWGDLAAAIDHGAVQRLRPKMMTVLTVLFALIPILWATGIGSDVMRRIAAPMVGGVTTSFLAELIVLPALYFLWRSRNLRPGPATILRPKPATALPESQAN